MNWYGKAFLEASVGGVIRKLCREKIAIEVDPARRSKGLKDIERNFELLTTWCQEFLDQIYAVRTECPQCVPQNWHLSTRLTLYEGAAAPFRNFKSACRKEIRIGTL